MSIFTAEITAPTDIIVGYIDRIEGYKEVTICEANDYASKNPGTTFLFLDKNKLLRYLNINEVNQLGTQDIQPSEDFCDRPINDEVECGETPRIEIFGGGGIGAQANPVIGRDGAILAVDVVRGGHGYQFAPEAEVIEECGTSSKALLRAFIDDPPIAEEWETYTGESDFEEFEICTPDDVEYGKVFDKNGTEIGTWDPKLYTNITTDPIAAEIKKYTEIIRKVNNKPFWATRTYRPDRISSSDDNLKLYDAIPVSFAGPWSDFMNQYAISPVPPSDNFGSDYAGIRFEFEWDQEFPLTGDYVFKGSCDDNAVLFLDNERIDNLGGFGSSPKTITRRIEFGIHRIRLELTNSTPVKDIESEYVDIPFEVYGEGTNDENISKLKFSFVSQDGKDSFTINNVKRNRSFRTETVRVRKNTIYKVLASTSKTGKLEQGLLQAGKKDKESGAGKTSTKIFADRIASDNDNDDIQLTARIGEFKSSNRRESGGRSTYDLTFKVTDTAIQQKPGVAQAVSAFSWNLNPMGVALTIDAPEPPAPFELIPPQVGRCPNNPIWSTRFPGGNQTWYPVSYPAPRTVTEITSAPKPSDKKLIDFTISGNTIKGLSDDLAFIFTAKDGSDSFSVGGALKNGATRLDKIFIKPNVEYRVKAKEDANRFRYVEQGLIRGGTKDKEQAQGTSNKIFADYIGTANDNNDVQVLAGAGTFSSSNKRRTPEGRITYDLTYKYIPGSSSPGLEAESKTYEIPGWSRFMNRYAVSPVKPLDSPGSDSSGISYSNTWTVNLPYDGFYGVQGTSDNRGQIIIDGSNTYQLDGFNNESPKVNKVFLTRGSHTIRAEIYNQPVETPEIIDQKIFRTADWINVVPPDAPKTVKVDFRITTRASKTNTIDIDGLFTASKANSISKTVEVGKEYTVTVVTANKSEFTNKKKEVAKLDKFDVNVAAALFGGDKYNVKLRKSNENGNVLEVEDSRDNDFNDLVCKASQGKFRQIKGNVCKFVVDGTPATPAGGLVGGTIKDGVTYTGPNLFHHTAKIWGDFMNSQSLSPYLPPLNAENKKINDTRTYTWSNVSFPEPGQYRVKFQADNFATLFINNVQVLTTSVAFESDPPWEYITISGGLATIKVVVVNNPARRNIFNENPTGFALEIRRDIVSIVTNKSSWASNPIGISAVLIPPPCPQKISGRGVITRIIPIFGGYYPVVPTPTPPPTPTPIAPPTPTPTQIGVPTPAPLPTPTPTEIPPTIDPEPPEPPTPVSAVPTPTDVPPTPATPPTPGGAPTPTTVPTPAGITPTPSGVPTPTPTPATITPTPATITPTPAIPPTPIIVGLPFPTPFIDTPIVPPVVPTPTAVPTATGIPTPTPTPFGGVDAPSPTSLGIVPTPIPLVPTPTPIGAPTPTAGVPTPSGIPTQIPGVPTPSGIPTQVPGVPTPSGIPTQVITVPTPSGIPTQIPGVPTPSGIPAQVPGVPTPSGIPTQIPGVPTIVGPPTPTGIPDLSPEFPPREPPPLPTPVLGVPTPSGIPTQIPGVPTPSGIPTQVITVPTPSGIPTQVITVPTPSGIPTQVPGVPTPSGIPTQVITVPTPSGIPTQISPGIPTPSEIPTQAPPSGPRTYPVTLRLVDVPSKTPGINYSPKDRVRIIPSFGTEAELVLGPFGSIQKIKITKPGIGFTRTPDIFIETETGVNFEPLPIFEVIRDPLLPPDRLIQVTDLVGLKQTGYVNGRAYYGSVFYKGGLKYAGVYETAGELVRVYDTLLESITGIVTTEPSAIQRQGTDVTNNDPRLNIPGTPENLI